MAGPQADSYQERAACPLYTAIGVIDLCARAAAASQLTPHGRTVVRPPMQVAL